MGDLELNKNIFLKTGQIYKDLLQPSNHGQIILGQCKTCKEGQKEELEPIVATEKMGLVAKFFQCANCLKGNQQLANVVKQFYGKEDDNQMTGKKWEAKKRLNIPFQRIIIIPKPTIIRLCLQNTSPSLANASTVGSDKAVIANLVPNIAAKK